MKKVFQTVLLAVVVAAGLQGILYLGAWMDDTAFADSVLQSLGDHMSAEQMEGYIREHAQRGGIPLASPEDVKVTIECAEGGGPNAVAGRLGSGIAVSKSCTVTGRVRYTRQVGLITKPVEIEQSKRFASAARMVVPSHRAIPDP